MQGGEEQEVPPEAESAHAGTGVYCCVSHSCFMLLAIKGPKPDELIGDIYFEVV